MARELVDTLPLSAAEAVLDNGSGVGTLLPLIQERAPEAVVVGSDIASGMLARAPQWFPRVTADAQQLPFVDASFDAAILAFMLFHVPEPARAVTEARRVLKTGSTIGTITWGDDPPYLAFDVWQEELAAQGAEAAPQLARHELVDTKDKVIEMLTGAGFRNVRTWIRIREEQQTLETFLQHRTGHGMSRHRFESLPVDARAAVIEGVRERLRDAGPQAFLDRSEVIYAIATAE